eukprot:GHVO01014268.1.p1 GENE.GHVO01014268.1~~GHVO01014268.1.p1  ORF type:complete len:500 (-),score=40.78 GHVO01014268.1:198-1697(-)
MTATLDVVHQEKPNANPLTCKSATALNMRRRLSQQSPRGEPASGVHIPLNDEEATGYNKSNPEGPSMTAAVGSTTGSTSAGDTPNVLSVPNTVVSTTCMHPSTDLDGMSVQHHCGDPVNMAKTASFAQAESASSVGASCSSIFQKRSSVTSASSGTSMSAAMNATKPTMKPQTQQLPRCSKNQSLTSTVSNGLSNEGTQQPYRVGLLHMNRDERRTDIGSTTGSKWIETPKEEDPRKPSSTTMRNVSAGAPPFLGCDWVSQSNHHPQAPTVQTVVMREASRGPDHSPRAPTTMATRSASVDGRWSQQFTAPSPPTAPPEPAATDVFFVRALAKVYEQLVKVSRAAPGREADSRPTRFHAIKAPDISIRDYLERIHKYFACSNECFVLSLIYIDRIIKLHDRFTICLLNIHRLMITSVMLATKFFDDVYYSNAFYARVGGVKTREINSLESHFLSLINYQLFVSPQEYDKYRRDVLFHAGVGPAIHPPAVGPSGGDTGHQ